MSKMIEMKVRGIVIDSLSKQPIVILEEITSEIKKPRILPICIGAVEAYAIAIVLEGILTPRPITHDLANNLVEKLGGAINRIEIVKLENDIYFADIVLTDKNGKEIRTDSRPSDAIALALRIPDAKIFVEEKVLAQTLNQAKKTKPDFASTTTPAKGSDKDH